MSAEKFEGLVEALGQKFGRLDNRVEKWAAHTGTLAGYSPQIKNALVAFFGKDSEPARIFSQASARHGALARKIPTQPLSAEEQRTATGYLNLRYFIYLNGFLQACAESLEKAKHNPAADPAHLVSNSYYTPYFFERVTISTEDVIAMLAADLARLSDAPPDRKGIVLAFRIRKGLVSTLMESYCPLYPWHYPPVARLGAVQASTDMAVIDEITSRIEQILLQLRNAS